MKDKRGKECPRTVIWAIAVKPNAITLTITGLRDLEKPVADLGPGRRVKGEERRREAGRLERTTSWLQS
jgi:hypothetical protein